MRAVNSFRTVSQLCRGNETVSAVRGASSGPAGQLTALAARGAARRASVLTMVLLERCRVDGVEVDAIAQHQAFFWAAPAVSGLTQRPGDGLPGWRLGRALMDRGSSYLEVPGGLPRRDFDFPTLVSYKSASFYPGNFAR